MESSDKARGGLSARWLRPIPPSPTLVLALAGALAAAAVAILRLCHCPTWVQVGAALLVLLIAIISAIKVAHEKETENQKREADTADQARVREREWQQSAARALGWWPLPLVGDVKPYDLGVRRSTTADAFLSAGSTMSPYVPRDADRPAADQLRARGMLLLVGEPSSGVTRTATMVTGSDNVRRRLLAPTRVGGLRAALDDLDLLARVDHQAPLLVWLDRIDQFSAEDVSPALLRRCLGHTPGSRVVATISTTAYGTWAVEHDDLADAFDTVDLGRLPSEAERRRAQALYQGVDFSEGIGAAFTATASLLRRLRTGNTDCPFEPVGGDCGLARPLVKVALAWTSTGTTRPLPLSLLSILLRRLNPGLEAPVSTDHIDAALSWAVGLTVERAALVRRTNSDQGEVRQQPAPPDSPSPKPSGLRGDPSIAAIWSPTSSLPTAVWDATITDAVGAGDSANVGRVGFTAHASGLIEEGARAWATISSLDEVSFAWIQRAAVFSERAHHPRARLVPLQHLLRLQEASLGPEHPHVARTLNNLGNAWLDLGDARQARDLYQRDLRIKEREVGPDHPEVAATLNNLGGAWFALGDARQARGFFERALTIEEREFGPDHRKVARTLSNLGGALAKLGDARQARDLFQWALRIKEREFGPDHPEVAATLNNLGGAWVALGDATQARDLYQRTLTINEREFGPDHPEVATTLNNLGNAWDVLGDASKARDFLQRALTIQEREFGPEHREVATTLNNLGNAWLGLGDAKQARDFIQRAVTIFEREFGPKSGEFATTLNNLARAWFSLGDQQRAQTLMLRSLRIRLERDDATSARTSRALLHRYFPDLIVLDDGTVMGPGEGDG